MYDVNNEGHSLDASGMPQDALNQELDEDRKILDRRLSETSANSSNQEICRICHWEGDGVDALVAPCYCSGSLRFVHQRCLQQWIKSSDIRCCELCKFQFVMNTKLKDFSEWECLQMGPLEKRKLVGKVAFHCIVLTCTLWSFYVLIERTIEELERGALEWPFWTKLTVVAFGLFGVSVFMHIQCKIYFNLCRRWRAFNRVIYIDNAPEKPALPSDAMPGISSVCSAPLVKPAECVVAIPPTCPPPTEPGAVTDHPETYALLNA